MEQQVRQCDHEITNVPERTNENLVSLLKNIGSVIGCTVHRDIVSIHRVPHKDCKIHKIIVTTLLSHPLRLYCIECLPNEELIYFKPPWTIR